LSILYIRLPSKAAADGASNWTALSCPFASVAQGDAIERQGIAPLQDLSAVIAKSQRVVLLLAASDVSLLRIKVPPMSAARLKTALPNLVEEQIISDPADCVMVAGGTSDGLRSIAVMQRAWLEAIHKAFKGFGARNIVATPSQLCLPYQEGAVSAAINVQEADIDVTLRLSEHEGIGLPIMPEQPGSAVHEVVQSLSAVVPQGPITLYVPQEDVRNFQEAADSIGAPDPRISVFADSWQHWIAGARGTPLDLMPGLGAASGPSMNWRPWRAPLALAAALLLINAVGLNFDWWRLKNEADGLRSAMTRIYKSAFPKETVIVDPVAQMRQKIAAAKRDSGQAAPDDFTALAAAFGEAWSGVTQGRKPGESGIAGLEYRERSLFVRLKLEGEAPTEQVRKVLAERGLSLVGAPSQGGAVVWQIRSGK
jgi:general secretion pathway protein L